jgi:hypothetical protein
VSCQCYGGWWNQGWKDGQGFQKAWKLKHAYKIFLGALEGRNYLSLKSVFFCKYAPLLIFSCCHTLCPLGCSQYMRSLLWKLSFLKAQNLIDFWKNLIIYCMWKSVTRNDRYLSTFWHVVVRKHWATLSHQYMKHVYWIYYRQKNTNNSSWMFVRASSLPATFGSDFF